MDLLMFVRFLLWLAAALLCILMAARVIYRAGYSDGLHQPRIPAYRQAVPAPKPDPTHVRL